MCSGAGAAHSRPKRGHPFLSMKRTLCQAAGNSIEPTTTSIDQVDGPGRCG